MGIFPGAVFSQNLTLLQQIEAHFKWGEYDSIIAKVEPVILDSITRQDGRTNSDFSKFLGIAYAAQGRIAEAQEQFKNAFLSDSLVNLDSAYVSKTIQEVFRTTIDNCKNETTGKAIQDSLIAQKKLAVRETNQVLEKEKRTIASNSALAVSGVCFAGFLISGAGAAYEYYSTTKAYTTFRLAAAQGDLATYSRYKTIVRNGDAWTAGYLSISCVLGICSGYFFYKFKKISWHSHSFFMTFSPDKLMAFAYEF
jgi:tetratricopeptide (TPR) repeat protein